MLRCIYTEKNVEKTSPTVLTFFNKVAISAPSELDKLVELFLFML